MNNVTHFRGSWTVSYTLSSNPEKTYVPIKNVNLDTALRWRRSIKRKFPEAKIRMNNL